MLLFMFVKRSLVAAGLLGVATTSASHGFSVQKNTPAVFQGTSPNTISTNVLNLTRSYGNGSQSGAMLYALRNNIPIPQYGAANLTSVQGFEFIASMQVGKQMLDFVVDTGSADTWVAEADFTCMDLYDYLEFPEEWCGFGTLYDSNSSTLSPIPDENIWVHYGDGRWAIGSLGYEKLRIGGISVKQEIGIIDKGEQY
jgi:aspergillopepsin I